MEFSETLTVTLALVGVVITIAALLSGLIERTEFPQVAVFLALGAALGPLGLGFLNIDLNSPVLRVVATLSLTLVLFTDAVNLDVQEVRRNGVLALLLLGPGTLLTALIVGVSAWWLLGLSPPAAAILGAALASTDPVLLRGLLRRRDVPNSARLGLRLESGLNDVVLLPIVVVAMTFLGGGEGEAGPNWGKVFLDLFLLGPGAGVLIGVCAVATLDLVRRTVGVRRDYEALYALGVAFTAYAAAEAVHGSGFLAAFAAGLAIAALDVELCDCFLEYGETTGEMTLLLTFVLLGSSLIWSGLGIIGMMTLIFAVVALFIRLPIYLLALARSHITKRARLLVAWFGPRGLSSLLLVLLPVFADMPGSDQLFTICSLVVICSVVLHGSFPLLLTQERKASQRRNGATQPPDDSAPSPVVVPEAPRRSETSAPSNRQDGVAQNSIGQPITFLDGLPQQVHKHTSNGSELRDESAGQAEETASGLGEGRKRIPDRISFEEMQRLIAVGEPVTLLDVRTERSYNRSDLQVPGAIRMPPDHVAERAEELRLAREGWVIGFCT